MLDGTGRGMPMRRRSREIGRGLLELGVERVY